MQIAEAQVAIAAGTTITAAATVTTARVPGGTVEITKAVIKVIQRGVEIAWGVYVAKILDAVLDVAENGRGIGDAIEKITVTMMGQFSETLHSFDGMIELIKKLLPPQ